MSKQKQKDLKRAKDKTEVDCSNCEYGWWSNHCGCWGCDYIGYNNQRRPCKTGKDCTVFTPSTGKKRFSEYWYGNEALSND